MCIRDSSNVDATESDYRMSYTDRLNRFENGNQDSRWSWGVTNTWGNSNFGWNNGCLLYTSDAADERSSVDLGGRRIIKKKKRITPSANQ